AASSSLDAGNTTPDGAVRLSEQSDNFFDTPHLIRAGPEKRQREALYERQPSRHFQRSARPLSSHTAKHLQRSARHPAATAPSTLRRSAKHSHFRCGATIFVTRPTLVSPAYRLSCLSMAQ